MAESNPPEEPPRLLELLTPDDPVREVLHDLVPDALPPATRESIRRSLLKPRARRWWLLAAAVFVALLLVLLPRALRPEPSEARGPELAADPERGEEVADAPDDSPDSEGPRPTTARNIVGRAEGLPNAYFHAGLDRCGGWMTLGEWLPREPLDPRIETLVVLWFEVEEGTRERPCQGEPIMEVSAAELSAYLEGRAESRRAAPAWRMRESQSACGRTYGWSVCGRDANGDYYASSDWEHDSGGQVSLPHDDSSRVRTPSGEVSVEELVRGHEVLSPSGVGHVQLVRQFAHRREVTLFFEDGSPAVLPSNIEVALARGGFRRANALEDGDAVLRYDGQTRVPTTIVETARAPSYTATLQVDGDGTLLMDDVLVRATPTPRRSERATVPVHTDAALRAHPLDPNGCHLQSLLQFDLEHLPANTVSLALRYARNTVAPGALSPLACEDALPWTEVPLALLRTLPEDSQGLRYVYSSLENPNDEPDTRIECMADYAVLACYRTQNGSLRSLPSASARSIRSGPWCFAAGTRVSTPEGARAIESLHPGDAVYSWQEGHRMETFVRGLYPRGQQTIRRLVLSNGRTLRVTDGHPLYSPRVGDYRPAALFEVGDALLGEDGRRLQIVAVHAKESAPVFDLSVGGPHNYFAEGVLAHNY